MLLTQEQKNKLIKTYPQMASVIEEQQKNELLRSIFPLLEKAHAQAKGDKGDTGPQGPTGSKGDSIRGPQGVQGEKGEKGDRGAAGITPIAGVDFPLPKDGKDGIHATAITPQEIADRLNTLPKALKASTIDGIPTLEGIRHYLTDSKSKGRLSTKHIDTSDLRWHGGGLSSVAHDTTLTGNGTAASPLSVISVGGVSQIIAGTNITVSPISGLGAVTINASGGGGSSGFQTPSGALNQAVFTWGTAPNAIVVDGVVLQKTQQDGNVNWTGTNVITLTGAFPSFSIFGIA